LVSAELSVHDNATLALSFIVLAAVTVKGEALMEFKKLMEDPTF